MITTLLTSCVVFFTGFTGQSESRLYDDCPCPTAECPSDINTDDAVDIADLLLVIDEWGTDNEAADVDDNGIVDIEDILSVIAAWGSNCEEQPETLPCPVTLPTIPAPMAALYCGDVTDRFVGCKDGIKYLQSPIRTTVMAYDSQGIQDNSAAALNAINQSDEMASAVWASIDPSVSPDCLQVQEVCRTGRSVRDSTATNLIGNEMIVPPFSNGVAGNALTLWTMSTNATAMYLVEQAQDNQTYNHDFYFYKLMDWAASVDFQFENGWDDKLIKATAILEAQFTTCPQGVTPPQSAEAQTLYRGAPVLCADYKLLKDSLSQGTPLYARNFFATSTDETEADMFINNGGTWPVKKVTWVLYEIDYRAGENIGYDMTPYSQHPDETEVLFPPYVEFTVTGISEGDFADFRVNITVQ
ncbi:MAG: hypothetical protein P8M22_08145 [Phycisphaerales bacterium]|nr:hypothetical protein [Phycisphaerales bacterium]